MPSPGFLGYQGNLLALLFPANSLSRCFASIGGGEPLIKGGSPLQQPFLPFLFRVLLLHFSISQCSMSTVKVLIIGGGLAGLSAAHSALERGANVVSWTRRRRSDTEFRPPGAEYVF